MVNGLGNSFSAHNSIANFNKIFDQHLQNVDKNFSQIQMPDFENLLEQKSMELASMPPFRTGIEINAGAANIPNLDLSMQDSAVVSKSSIENALDGFGKGFAEGIKSINQQEMAAEHAVETLASGGDISVHEVMIAAEKANLSMQMGLQLRNKILAAYNELYNVRI